MFNFEFFNEQHDIGIGGGYGQFGILTESEFNTLIKANGKRIKKFTEHPDQFKKDYGN